VHSQPMSSYKVWRKIDVDIKTQHLLFENMTGYTGVPEVVLYGYPSNATPVENENKPPVISPISNISMSEGEVKTINVSATDPDGDAMTLSLSGLPSFAKFTDKGDGTGSLVLSP